MQAVFLDRNTLMQDADMAVLAKEVDELKVYPQTSQNELLANAKGAEILISNKVVIDESAMQALQPTLKLICVAATGFNHIAVAAAKEYGITVCNVPSYSTTTVAQHVFTLMLNLATNVMEYVNEVKTGDWQKSKYFCLNQHQITELNNKTLGIIGYGEIGQHVASIAKAFGMRVLIAKIRPDKNYAEQRLALSELLPKVDYLTVHCPLNDQTKNLIAQKELATMQPSAYLINTARGGIVNEADLAYALENNIIAGAGFDVLSTEPPAADNPLININQSNFVLTPHIAWSSQESQQKLVDIMARNINGFINNNVINSV